MDALSRYLWSITNAEAPANPSGQVITAGASSVEGTPVQVLDNLANDAYRIRLRVSDCDVSGSGSDMMLTVYQDPTGGTSWVPVPGLTNLIVAQASQFLQGGIGYRFRRFFKKDAAIAVSLRSALATPPAAPVVFSQVWGKPTRPELEAVCTVGQVLGTVTGEVGTAITLGASGAAGAWVSLGVTTKPLRSWQVGFGLTDTGIAAKEIALDLGYGDGSTKHVIIHKARFRVPDTGERVSNEPQDNTDCELPKDTELFVRGSSSGTAESNTYALAYGTG